MSDKDKTLEEILATPIPPRPPPQPDPNLAGYMEESDKARARRLAREVKKRERQEAKQRRLADR
jgi:hypothetical protein